MFSISGYLESTDHSTLEKTGLKTKRLLTADFPRGTAEGESPAGGQGVNNEATHRCMDASMWDTCAKRPLIRNKGKFLEPQDLPHPSLLQEGDPFQGPKLGSRLTLRNELPKETHVLTGQETLRGRAPRQRAGR